jgi:conjugative transfer signal peptidase TraF
MKLRLHRRCTQPLLGRLLLLAGAAALASVAVSRPWVLINTTPSEPQGLYLTNFETPSVGRLVAFRTPGAAFPYADAKLGFLHHTPVLKAVAAARGDLVCTTGGRLAINGRDRGPVASTDEAGRALPRWIGCRRLTTDELFALSDRVPNSFDSRYFGPVSRQAVLGVYVPLLVAQERR